MKRFLILGVLAGMFSSAHAAPVAQKKLGSGVSVGFGMAFKWYHGKGTLKTKLQSDFNAGYVVSSDGTGITRPERAPHYENGLDFAGRADHPTAGAGDIIPFGSTLAAYQVSEDDDAEPGLVIDFVEEADDLRIAAFYAERQDAEFAFMRGFEFPESVMALSENVGNARAFWEEGISAMNLNTDLRKREWLFGRANGLYGAPARDGAVSAISKRTAEAERSDSFQLDRPAIDLLLTLSFDLNKHLSFAVTGGYSFIFGDPVVQESMTFMPPVGSSEDFRTLGGRDIKVPALVSSSFSRYGMASDVKTETTIKEGWRLLVGFNAHPTSSMVCSFGVGTKEVSIETLWKGGVFYMPMSPSLRNDTVLDTSGKNRYALEFAKETKFSAKVHPLLWHISMGICVNDTHMFSIGFDYAMVNATLAPSDNSNAAKKGVADPNAVQKTSAENTFANPVGFLGSDYSLSGNIHMSYAGSADVRRACEVSYRELAFSLIYSAKF